MIMTLGIENWWTAMCISAWPTNNSLSHCRVTNDDSSRQAAIQRVLNAVGADA
jgi:hypothetical protein